MCISKPLSLARFFFLIHVSKIKCLSFPIWTLYNRNSISAWLLLILFVRLTFTVMAFVIHLFSLLNSILLYRDTVICVSMLALMNIWVISVWAIIHINSINILLSIVLVTQLYPILYNPMDWSPPGSSVHGISQVRILEWIAISFSKGSSQPRNRTWVSSITGRFFTNWAMRQAQKKHINWT